MEKEVKGMVPPQAIDLEQVVLGAIIVDTKAMDEVLEAFTNPDVFYKSEHRFIFEAAKELYDASQPIDLLTLSQKLKSKKKLADVGGDFYLVKLSQMVASSAHTNFHSFVLLQKYMGRQLISFCQEGIKNAYDTEMPVFDAIDAISMNLDKLTDASTAGHSSISWSDAILSIPKRVEFLTNNDGKITGVPTGLKKLDRHFSGWQPSDLIVIGADSGMGKTALVMCNMLAAAENDEPVGMFSMEMSVVQLATRGVATRSNFHMNQLMRTGFEKTGYFDGLQRAVDNMKDLPIHIDDKPALTVSEMKRKARALYRKHKIKLLVVDFLQMFSGDKDPRLNISEAARELKNIAKELNIPVIALSQLSREVKKERFKIPAKHHLKESSAIEEAADVIMLLYRPSYYGYTRENQPDLFTDLQMDENANAVGIVCKNRNGALGNVSMRYIENKTKYVDVESGNDTITVDENNNVVPSDDDTPF